MNFCASEDLGEELVQLARRLFDHLLSVGRFAVWEHLGPVGLVPQPFPVPPGDWGLVADPDRFLDDVVLLHQIVPDFVAGSAQHLQLVGIKVFGEELLEVVLAVREELLVLGRAPLADEDTEVQHHVADFLLLAVYAI